MKTKTPLKAPGGKHYIAELIAQNMPKHVHFVEPFAFSAAVLFATVQPERSEVINDVDKQVSNFWRVLQEKKTFADFQRTVASTPFSQVEFKEPMADLTKRDVIKSPCAASAARFFIRTRFSYCGIGKAFAPISRNRTRMGINEQASAWMSSVDRLDVIHQRLRGVVVLCDDFEKAMKSQDGAKTWHYCDPPYVVDDQTGVDDGLYRHGFTKADHVRFLATCNAVKGKVTISGYANKLYNAALPKTKWRRLEVSKASAMTKTNGDGKPQRLEVLWMNY